MTTSTSRVHIAAPHENTAPHPPTPLGESANNDFEDRMLIEMEEHSPEGRETHGIPSAARKASYFLAAIAVVGALTGLAFLAGPPALLLGIAIVAAMYGIAALPQWGSARVRREERRGFERTIDTRLKRIQRRAARHTHGV